MLSIKQLRAKIDKIDINIIKMLSQRKTLSIKIGKLKSNTKIIDNKREKALMLRYKKLCSEYQLQLKFVKNVFKIIIANSRELQK